MSDTIIPTTPTADSFTDAAWAASVVAAISSLDGRLSGVEIGSVLPNSSFEDVDGNGALSNWTATENGITFGRSTLASDMASEGSYSAKLTGSGASGDCTILSDVVKVVGGTVVVAGACFLLDDGDMDTCEISVIFYDEDGETDTPVSTVKVYDAGAVAGSLTQPTLPTGDSSAQFRSRYAVARVPDHARYAKLQFYFAFTGGSAPTLYMDSAKLQQLKPSPECGKWTNIFGQNIEVYSPAPVGTVVLPIFMEGDWILNTVAVAGAKLYSWVDGAWEDIDIEEIESGLSNSGTFAVYCDTGGRIPGYSDSGTYNLYIQGTIWLP